jgi:predicted nucleic acid-binding protein
LVTNPRRSAKNAACAKWLQSLLAARVRVIVPEIADYEVRREPLRAKKTKGIGKLDALIGVLEYLPITTPAMRRAALFWAQARQQGKPTAADKALDADMILVAQAVTLGEPGVVIATTNVGHLSLFAPAELWHNIKSS